MDFSALSNIAPPVAAVAIMVVALIKFLEHSSTIVLRLLDLLTKFDDTLKANNANMAAHTDAIREMGHNVSANTQATEKLTGFLESKKGR